MLLFHYGKKAANKDAANRYCIPSLQTELRTIFGNLKGRSTAGRADEFHNRLIASFSVLERTVGDGVEACRVEGMPFLSR